MTCLQKPYRTPRVVVRAAMTISLLSSIVSAQVPAAKTPPAAPSAAAAAPAKPGTPTNDPKPPAESVLAQKQHASTDAMSASLDKQRNAVKSQLGGSVPADPFFTTTWSSAATLEVPAIVPACGPMPEDELKPLVAESAQKESLKPELIRAVIHHESDSYPCAVSDRGALGLMQLMPDVAQQFGVDAFDPKQNVTAGSRYLKQLLTRYKGNEKLALAAYNAGPQRVDSEQKVPDIPETTAYVEAIEKDLKQVGTGHP